MSTIVKTVNKTELKELDFYKSDVLFSDIEKSKRKLLLERACNMGSRYEGKKAKLIFACSDGIKKVEARVISLTKTSITLKGVCSLPIKSVIGVNIS